jgi:hypothetical protein
MHHYFSLQQVKQTNNIFYVCVKEVTHIWSSSIINAKPITVLLLRHVSPRRMMTRHLFANLVFPLAGCRCNFCIIMHILLTSRICPFTWVNNARTLVKSMEKKFWQTITVTSSISRGLVCSYPLGSSDPIKL